MERRNPERIPKENGISLVLSNFRVRPVVALLEANGVRRSNFHFFQTSNWEIRLLWFAVPILCLICCQISEKRNILIFSFNNTYKINQRNRRGNSKQHIFFCRGSLMRQLVCQSISCFRISF